MQSSAADKYICDFDLKDTIVSFSEKKRTNYLKFVKLLNEDELWKKLMESAIGKNFLQSDVRLKVKNARTLMDEFNRLCCNVEHLCECLKGQGLLKLFVALGIYEKLHVINQPGCGASGTSRMFIPSGKEMQLSFIVEGYPIPNFTWYFNGSPIDNATSENLIISNFRKEAVGKYYCIAYQRSEYFPSITLVSDIVDCELLLVKPVLKVDLPSSKKCVEDDDVELCIVTDDDFDGNFEWIHSDTSNSLNSKICQSKTNNLIFKNVSLAHRGNYKCILKKGALETHSNICNLEVERCLVKPTAKLALILGCCNYLHFPKLRTPAEDVNLVARTFKQLGFSVIALVDSSVKEIKNTLSLFFSAIPAGSYVVFYYSGHGFELSNNAFLIPTNCPPDGHYSLGEHCIHHQYIIKKIMHQQPTLCLTILDMCLSEPDKLINTKLYCEKIKHHSYQQWPYSTLIKVSATSDYQAAYERISEKNGLYCKCLCQNLMKNLPILELFSEAHADFGFKSLQIPQVTHSNNQEDIRLIKTPFKNISLVVDEIFTLKPKCVLVNLKKINTTLLINLKQDQTINNAYNIYIIVLSGVQYMQFSFLCKELNFKFISHVKVHTNGTIPYAKISMYGLERNKKSFTVEFRCKSDEGCDFAFFDVNFFSSAT